jgi:hypothetical protein
MNVMYNKYERCECIVISSTYMCVAEEVSEGKTLGKM